MEKDITRRYLEIWDMAQADPEYQRHHLRYTAVQKHFVELLENMEPEQRDVVLEYIAAGSELHLRFMELACKN